VKTDEITAHLLKFRPTCTTNTLQPQRLSGRKALLYMIIEHFKNQDPVPVYRRFDNRGRLAPEGLRYVSSWVDEKLDRCFQLMETEDRKLLREISLV